MNSRNSAEFERAMALLAAEHAAASAPVSVEQAVLATFDASRRRRYWGMAAAAAIAAMLGAGAALLRERPAPRPVVMRTETLHRVEMPAMVQIQQPAKPRPRKRAVVPRTEPAEAPFITIPYTVPLAPEENVRVVRMTLSPSAMAVAGFPLPAIDPGLGTQADVLVGEDGRARAIRIVASSNVR
jgi:hypothetical protein